MKIREDEFLAALLPRLEAGDLPVPPGDDCAAIPWHDDLLMLLACDQVARDVHFTAATEPELVGRKLLARNLSDIAAMGGVPRYALLCLALDCDRAWLDRMIDGLMALAVEFGVKVIGGDTGAAATTVAGLTIVGEVRRPCRRDGARPGDRIVVTGSFGNAVASGWHLRFVPRLREGAWLAGEAGAHAMIDASDGLYKDLGRLCRASGLRAVVDPAAIPCHATVEQAWLDGEDYELIAALPEAPAAWPFATRLTEIGRFSAGAPGIVDSRGQAIDPGRGWEHWQ